LLSNRKVGLFKANRISVKTIKAPGKEQPIMIKYDRHAYKAVKNPPVFFFLLYFAVFLKKITNAKVKK